VSQRLNIITNAIRWNVAATLTAWPILPSALTGWMTLVWWLGGCNE